MSVKPEYQTRTAKENTATGDETPVAAVQYEKFEEIFRQTKDRLYHFTLKLTQNSSDAKDILQECYGRLWEKLPEINTREEVLPLLLTYARHCFIDQLRKRERDALFLSKLSAAAPATELASAELFLNLADKEKQLRISLEQLPAKRREIFSLVKEKGFSHKEVAEQLGISTATVEKQVSLSLKFLRGEMMP